MGLLRDLVSVLSVIKELDRRQVLLDERLDELSSRLVDVDARSTRTEHVSEGNGRRISLLSSQVGSDSHLNVGRHVRSLQNELENVRQELANQKRRLAEFRTEPAIPIELVKP